GSRLTVMRHPLMRGLFVALAVAVLSLPFSLVGQTSPTADLIVVNADIYTSDSLRPRAKAFAVSQGRFIAVGDEAEVRRLAGRDTRIIDAGGRTVTPGFIDGHSHVSGDAPRVAGVDLSYIAEKAEWLRLIEAADRRLPKGEWLTGGYWDHTLSDGRYPTREMLDAIAPDRPIFLTHIDGHYAWVNSKALEIASVNESSAVPPGGEIVLDAKTGKPAGVLLEGAMSLVRQVIPERNAARRREGLAQMQAFANSIGITGLHQMGDLADYLHLLETARPSIRVWYGQVWSAGEDVKPVVAVRDIIDLQESVTKRVSATRKTISLGPLLEVGYVKLMNDGVLSARTAVMLDDYSDQPGWRGEFIMSPDSLKAKVKAINAAGLPVAIHSIGDAAVRASLDAFEAAVGSHPKRPNRVEHIEVVTPADIRRFKKLGVVASMQPNHCTNAVGYVPTRLGPRRQGDAYVWRTMLSAGVPLVFGADYPTSPLDPLTQIADAMFRTSPFGFADGKPWFPEQALSFEEALLAYTRSPAEITDWASEIGSISPGKWADFVLLSGRVPQPMNPSFRTLKVDATYFAGSEVFSSGSSQTSTE
ncbi:MAG: amidohydrolase, partial [Gammaproteobacteria bacterium]